MHEHGPNELVGPLRGTTAWWRGTAAATELVDEGLSAPSLPPTNSKKGRKDTKPLRHDLVSRIRKEIADGTYDTDQRWYAALDCLLDRIEPID
jgi:hypothetical protein